MKKQRDRVEEILKKMQRLEPKTPRWNQLESRVGPLWFAYLFVRGDMPRLTHQVQNELLRYFPIAIVAYIEGYFCLVFRDLINAGSPYRENVANFKEDFIRFKIQEILALDKKVFSLGDLISHMLPINNLENINLSMSTLLGRDFLKSLGASKTYKGIKRVFELRHIFVHEIASREKLQLEEINEILIDSLVFIGATETMVRNLVLK